MNASTFAEADVLNKRVDCFGEISESLWEPENYYGIDLRPGQLLDGRFRLGRIIAHSGMASIFLARDLQDQNRPVAIKAPHRRMEADPAFFSRFQREEEIGLEMDHPFILKFIRVENKSRPYIAMEYLDGMTLAHLLPLRKPLPEKDALKIARLVGEAVRYLHSKGVVHRDLKPGNIMVCRDQTIRIMDFGLATLSGFRKITMTGLTPMLGTPEYMAPEQVRNQRTDTRTDIYGLGTILYEMLTGEVPFANENAWRAMNDRVTGDPLAPRAIRPEISEEAEEIVLHCMQRKPEDRPQKIEDLMEQLEAPENVRVTGLARRLKKPRFRIGLHSTPLLAGVLIGIGILFLQSSLFLFLSHSLGRK